MDHNSLPEDQMSYRPSGFYFRQAVRNAKNAEELEEIALAIILEHERLREWVRAQGLIPPKWVVAPEEAAAKGWDEVG